MATKPQAECPLCQTEMDPSEELEDHLVEEHSLEELASTIVSDWEETESGTATE